MHTLPLFAVHDRDQLHELVLRYPLATLFVQTAHGAEANLLPMLLADKTGVGRLAGHFAKTHPLCAEMPEGSEVLAVFQGPNHYISPRWYVNGQRSKTVAPSWNYVAVQARGRIRFIDDPQWMLGHLSALTDSRESGRADPWSMAEAAPEFIQSVTQRLIGFEIELHELTGRRFLSQQRTEADRRKLIEQLDREPSGSAHDLARLITP